jgi:hypothetical protein
MTVTNTLGLLEFLSYFVKELDKIFKDEKVSWKDIPYFLGILFKVKLAITGIKNLNSELTGSTDEEISQLVIRLQGVAQQVSDLIAKHQDDVVHTASQPEVDMEGFSEEAFRNAISEFGIKIK